MTLGAEDKSGSTDLYRSETLLVRQVPAGSTDRWVVTFDHYGIGRGFDRHGFGEAYLRAQGISAIHVLGRGDDWYQYADMEKALAAVRAATAGAEKVLTYGSSMGGYAALRFADAVGATDALALSPQYSIAPDVAGHEQRWSQDIRRIRWRPDLNGSITCSARAIVVFDPTGADGWHGERIVKDIACHPVRLPYTAHPVSAHLSETGLLSSMVSQVLDGSFDPQAFRREARRRRRKGGIYMSELAQAQPTHRPTTALALARHAVEMNPGNFHAQINLGRLLSQSGRHDEAVATFAAVVEQSDRFISYLVEYGQALVRADRMIEAQTVAEEALAQTTDVAHLHAWAAYIRWRNGDGHGARRLIRRAVALEPANADYQRLMADYHLGLHQPEGMPGVRVTPWLRLARWLMAGRLSERLTSLTFRPRASGPASGNA